MPTPTTNYGLEKPLVNNATDQDLWGGYLNDDLDELDGLIKTAINWTPSAQTANFSVTAPTTGSAITGSARVLYLCDATLGTITAALPAASTCTGMVVAFKKIDASANTVVIDGNAAELIDGAGTQTLSARYQYLVIECDGTGWNIIGQLGFVNGGVLADGTTATTQPVNDRTLKVATTAFANPAASLVANGYVKLPCGLLLQWGSQAVGGGATTTISFPIAFSSAVFGVYASKQIDSFTTSNYNESTGASPLSLSQFQIRNGFGGGTFTFYWWAIGI